MEYEIEDDEALFHESTNPSLEHGAGREKQSETRRAGRPDATPDKRRKQEGVHIPEEERGERTA